MQDLELVTHGGGENQVVAHNKAPGSHLTDPRVKSTKRVNTIPAVCTPGGRQHRIHASAL